MKTRQIRFLWPALGMGVLLSSCADRKAETSTPNAAPARVEEMKGVGRIASVNREKGFVLIRMNQRAGMQQTDLFFSKGKDRTASLRPTGERIGQYLTADITSGEVQLGDSVSMRDPRSLFSDDSQGAPEAEAPLTSPGLKEDPSPATPSSSPSQKEAR